MNLSFELIDPVGVIAVSGDFDASVAEEFDHFFRTHAKQTSNIVMDLSKVTFIDSTGLGRIVAALRRVAEKEGDLKLCGINKNIMLVFQITRAHRIFDIFDSQEEAINAFNK